MLLRAQWAFALALCRTTWTPKYQIPFSLLGIAEEKGRRRAALGWVYDSSILFLFYFWFSLCVCVCVSFLVLLWFYGSMH